MTARYQIFPNPVTTHFIVKSVTPLDERIDLSIFSLEGLLLQKTEFTHPDDNFEYSVDVTNFPPGGYYIMIHSDRGDVIERMNKK
jgi:hypothetical protein